MKYIMMTLDEAKKIADKDTMVLVSIQDLKNQDCNLGFEKKKFKECYLILEGAKTIAKGSDDIFHLKVFSDYQSDIINYKPSGTLSTILFHNKTDVC